MHEPLRCLIVEDEALLMMQLEEFLEEAGHAVVATAMSSREAIEAVLKVHADLALVDIHLADGPTGIEVGRYISEHSVIDRVEKQVNVRRIIDHGVFVDMRYRRRRY